MIEPTDRPAQDSNDNVVDFLVVGGGIVGLATAYQLMNQFPDARLAVLEKESQVAAHQSGRNSGVLHSGIYYKPGSLKAVTCRQGKRLMEQFCDAQEISYQRCGKIIVAVDEIEIERLDRIQQRGMENGVSCRRIDVHEIRELEPHAAGVAALHVPESGIVDYPAVCQRLADLLRDAGHIVALGQEVVGIDRGQQSIAVRTLHDQFFTGFLVTCGGLHSDRLARLAGLRPPAKIVPFRGEYYELVPEARSLCRNLIYPVPDPSFPFLGVHVTRMIGGEVECGPNAVFAMSREGYSWRDIGLGDLYDSLTYGGFLKIAAKHWKTGLGEIGRSLSKGAFVKALQRLVPDIRAEQLKPCRAGVRAQAIGPDGAMVDDFLWVSDRNMLHVCNAPSPGATASLEIGNQIVQQITEQLQTNC